MKITEITEGLIKIEADKDKVITSLAPSALREKLLYINKDNIDNYIEIDEVPEIKLPEEYIDIEEPEEILDGLTLVEAYHQLINENRVLKEENEIQNNLMDTIIMANDYMYRMLESLFVYDVLSNEVNNPIINMYVAMVRRGIKDKNNIPDKLRDKVIEEINKCN